jgi:predicted Holliday junction resolvase-like endonuclease
MQISFTLVLLSWLFLGSLLIGTFLYYFFKVKKLKKEQAETLENFNTRINKALQRSKNVLRGQVAEELLPLFSEFEHNLSDCKFMGQPIDYVVFKGMSDVRDLESGEISVIFADVKVNTSRTTKVQNAIREAIKAGRISFETWHVKDGKLRVK